MDPIAIANEVEERYRRYLETTFYFRDPDFRRTFKKALREEGLSRGPFIEGTPVYLLTVRTDELVRSVFGATPDPGFLQALKGGRRLYWHQEQAIRRAVQGRSLLVAAGTGSGKTEAFLYPILLSLYREFLEGTLRAGVRALLLYPMNALANDQRQRLGQIARALELAHSPFAFTFGQYIGETPENRNDTHRDAAYWEQNRLPGELVFREEMRNAPPHILVTNYSMLEYLLTRPWDSPLFDNGAARDWRFIVIDEVHQYRGSEGTEMALLLRRLKRRLREGGRTGPFQCIATSATLAGGEEDVEAAARFATDLCDEPFSVDDVILPRTVPIDLSTGRAPGSGSGGLDPQAQELRRLVTGQVRLASDVAAQLFPDLGPAEGTRALAALAERLVRTEDSQSGSPLLSTRFHLFLRALEGAYVQFWPTRRVVIDQRSAEGPIFEVALCRECGQHYLVAPRNFTGGKITAPVRDPGLGNFGVTYLRELSPDAFNPEGDERRQPDLELCVRCGRAAAPGRLEASEECDHANRIPLVIEEPPADEDRADQLVRCGACGYRGHDPVREVVHGTDGPHAVIATTLVRSLPEERRKVLAFVDGRQEAAFFAWYLERSYADLATRNLLYRTLCRFESMAPEGLSLGDLAGELVPLLRQLGMVPASAGALEVHREVWTRLFRELLADSARISLEGVGLARWDLLLPDRYDLDRLRQACPVPADEATLKDLAIQLLDTIRFDRAVELLSDGNGPAISWDQLDLQGIHGVLALAPSDRRTGRTGPGVKHWDGPKTGRSDFLQRWLRGRGLSEPRAALASVEFLRALWEWVLASDGRARHGDDRLFREQASGRMRLNPRWYRLRRVREDGVVYQCQVCGRIYHRSVEGVCPRYRCSGTLLPLTRAQLEPDHYRDLYQDPNLVGPMRVEEHTAQLTSRTAREYQEAFQNGKIQLLSSSTTFELGVDLGDLDAIFLRNVPPEASNYVQRVGRSGRRSGHPGLAITYCRRTPHDLYHFRKPNRILLGQTRPPVLHLSNEKIIGRHMTAHVLSYFFRSNPHRFEGVKSLIGNFERPSLVDEVCGFINRRRNELELSLKAVIPRQTWRECGLEDGTWAERVAGQTSRLAVAEATVVDDWRSLKRFEEESAKAGRYRAAGWANRRAATLEAEEVLSFLSRHVVIPKYGFPVDVVTLEALSDSEDVTKVELQRDLRLAIAEFAPSSRIVANKKEWVAYGLKRAPSKDREWPKRNYRHCPRCNTFEQWSPGDPTPPPRCGHKTRQGQYVVPAFGFVTAREPPQQPRGRQPRLFTTRPYFAGPKGASPPTLGLPAHDPLLVVTPASPGKLVVLCEGRRGNGFYICPECGAGFPTLPDGHQDPYGRPCRGQLERVALAHEYETDVLRLQFQVEATGDVADVEALSFSVAYALLEGAASVLETPPGDLSVTVAASSGDDTWPIILYDDVPGGAGLVGRLQSPEVLVRVVEAAVERTDGSCGCKREESCYGCLRSYRNQFIQHKLGRGLAHEFLTHVLRELGARSAPGRLERAGA
ncbi:MAG: DEAD/DEAH box helicase [Bacillota bacterium]